MSSGHGYTTKDYLALGLSLLLAFAVWFIHNLSLTYSDLLQCSFTAECEIDGHSNLSQSQASVVARCELRGSDIVLARIANGKSHRMVRIATDDMKPYRDDIYFMSHDELAKYFRDFFPSQSRLEYFVTDTVFFRFPPTDSRKVPVRAMASFGFRPQYIARGDLRLYPDSVLVYGRREYIDAVAAVNTNVMNFSDIHSDLIGEVTLAGIPNVRISASKVQYSMAVTRYVENEFLLDVTATNVPEGVILQIFPSSATVRIRSAYPGNLSDESLGVAVDFNDFERSISGKCTGVVTGMTESVLGYSMEPEVFDCIIRVQQ